MTDNLSPVQRSYCMSRIKGSDTGLEKTVQSALRARKYRFRKHLKSLPGKPDIAFTKKKVAVLADGDFWHGYRFSSWKKRVSRFWQLKIAKNRERDFRNHRKLRYQGWTVIRLWGHEVQRDIGGSVEKVVAAVKNAEKRR
jgi:DNA mismatch endonuclease (patch repair protein)